MSFDEWRHRTKMMSCQTCMYYVEKSAEIGRCRRHAPTLGGWPAVYPATWCGDHKIDEAKLDKAKEASEPAKSNPLNAARIYSCWCGIPGCEGNQKCEGNQGRIEVVSVGDGEKP